MQWYSREVLSPLLRTYYIYIDIMMYIVSLSYVNLLYRFFLSIEARFLQKKYLGNFTKYRGKHLQRSSHRRSSIKKVLLKLSQISQVNICATVSFSIKLQAWRLQFYWKRDSGASVLLWTLQNFKNTSFTEHLR